MCLAGSPLQAIPLFGVRNADVRGRVAMARFAPFL